jgi:hypothetical protein
MPAKETGDMAKKLADETRKREPDTTNRLVTCDLITNRTPFEYRKEIK